MDRVLARIIHEFSPAASQETNIPEVIVQRLQMISSSILFKGWKEKEIMLCVTAGIHFGITLI